MFLLYKTDERRVHVQVYCRLAFIAVLRLEMERKLLRFAGTLHTEQFTLPLPSID